MTPAQPSHGATPPLRQTQSQSSGRLWKADTTSLDLALCETGLVGFRVGPPRLPLQTQFKVSFDHTQVTAAQFRPIVPGLWRGAIHPPCERWLSGRLKASEPR